MVSEFLKRFMPVLACMALPCLGPAQTGGSWVGSPAPELNVDAWLYGKPWAGFGDGNIYIVEFTAIGCPPCVKTMKHLNRSAYRFGRYDVRTIMLFTFYGYGNGRTQETHRANVHRLIGSELQDSIHVAVGLDRDGTKSGEVWRIRSVPTVFVVDGKGTIRFEGHPAKGMEEAVESLLAGDLDDRAILERQMAFDRAFHLARELTEREDVAAVQLIDSLLAEVPDDIDLHLLRYRNLARTDTSGAQAWLRWMLDEGPGDQHWGAVAACVSGFPSEANYRLAIEAARRYRDEAPPFLQPGRYLSELNVHIKRTYGAATHSEKASAREQVERVCKEAIESCIANGDSANRKMYEETLRKVREGKI